MTPIRIALADDHNLFRNGLKTILHSYPGLDIRIEAGNGKELLEQMTRHRIDVVVTDLSMPDMDGISLTRVLCRDYKDIKVIGISMHDTLYHIKQMLGAGAKGYVLKSADPDEMAASIKQVHRGKVYFCSGSMAVLTRDIAGGPGKDDSITPREMQVLKLIFEERIDQEIADFLKVSLKTVTNDRKELLRKTQTKTAIGLVKWVIDRGGLEGV